MQGNVAEIIRELMDIQQLSVRKVSARVAEKHGGSIHGYTQQISRILNDPSYDPTLSTVQKILSALNVSFVQVSQVSDRGDRPTLNQIMDRLDRLGNELSEIKGTLMTLEKKLGVKE